MIPKELYERERAFALVWWIISKRYCLLSLLRLSCIALRNCIVTSSKTPNYKAPHVETRVPLRHLIYSHHDILLPTSSLPQFFQVACPSFSNSKLSPLSNPTSAPNRSHPTVATMDPAAERQPLLSGATRAHFYTTSTPSSPTQSNTESKPSIMRITTPWLALAAASGACAAFNGVFAKLWGNPFCPT